MVFCQFVLLRYVLHFPQHDASSFRNAQVCFSHWNRNLTISECLFHCFLLFFRCVHSEQRSFALGIQWIVVRVLGTIPAPMIFGSLIDDSCILWQESCNEAGACLLYDNASLSRYMLYLALTAKLCSTIFFFGAWFSYVPPKHIQANGQESNEHTEDEREQEVIIYNSNRNDQSDDHF